MPDQPATRAAFDLATTTRQVVTPEQVAADPRVDCHVRTIIRMLIDGSLHGYKVGKRWKIPVDAAREAFHVPRGTSTPPIGQ